MLAVCAFAVPDVYKQNCSNVEAMAWQGDPMSKQSAFPSAPTATVVAVASHSVANGVQTGMAADPPGQARGAKQLLSQHLVSSCLKPLCSPAVSGGGQQDQAPKSGWKGGRASRTLPTPTGLGAGLSIGKQMPSSFALQASLPQPAEAAPDDATAVGEVLHGRESLGGTQGAITGLTHMALQKHTDALPAASAGGPVESQGLGMQVGPSDTPAQRRGAGDSLVVDTRPLAVAVPLTYHVSSGCIHS